MIIEIQRTGMTSLEGHANGTIREAGLKNLGVLGTGIRGKDLETGMKNRVDLGRGTLQIIPQDTLQDTLT